jgi:hypothetical protein
MARLSAVEWDIIDARVRAVVTAHGLPTASLGFLYLVLEQFCPGRSGDYSEIVTDGSNDRGIDAIEIIESSDQALVYLFQSKYRDGQKTTDKTINDAEVLRISTFLHEVFDKSDHLRKTGNLQLTEAVGRIWKLHERGVLCRYRIVLCSNDQGLSASARGILESAISGLPGVDYETYGPGELIRDIGVQGKPRETGYLQVIGKEAFERTDGDIRGVIASVDARSFVELIRTEDGRSVKRHLFDDNLRVFLGSNGGYNGAIIETASSSDSHLFWYLNNGITITCRNYSYNKGHANPKIRIEDFQIVNGAQTSHSLLEASRRAPEALENVVLTVRVYATDRDDIAERVAVATNSQARIQSRDLRANHPVLKKMEIAFADRGYFFERKRAMHSDRDPKRRVDALKLGQIIMSYHLREPDRAKTDSDSIFGDRFSAIFHEHYDMDELCRLIELYAVIEEMKDTYIAQHGDNVEGGGEQQYLIYGHWFILFAVRLLLVRSGKPLPPKDDAKELIAEAISLVARACSQGKSVAHYQMFRSHRTRDKILAELSGKQMSLLDLLEAMGEHDSGGTHRAAA